MASDDNNTTQSMGFIEQCKKMSKFAAILLIVWLSGYYALSFAWILIAIFLAFLYRKQIRNRKELRSARIEFSDEQECLKKAFNNLPSWVNFPDVQRAEWLNSIIHQFWPYFGKVVEGTLREYVEPLLQSKVPTSLNGIQFQTIRLGDLSPRVGGIKVHINNVQRSEIILDVEIIYAGDSKITLVAKGLKVGVEDFQIRGTLRVVLYPLIPEKPLLGGLSMYFINRPIVDFELTNMLNVLETPGLITILRSIVDDAIAGFMVLPNKITIPLSDKIKQGELQNRLPDGVLRIKVVEARDLMAKDFKILGNGGTSDPYVTVIIGAEKFTTSVKPCSLNPTWNETFEMFVEESNRRTIEISVFDKDRLPSRDESLGTKILTMANLLETGYQDLWFSLDGAKTGKLHLQLTWLKLNDESDVVKAAAGTTPSKKSTLAKAALIVHIDSACNLPRNRNSNSACNPVCKVIVGHSSQKTNKLSDTVNPVWEQSFNFLIQEPEYQDAKFQLWDHKKDRLLGSLCYKINNLLAKKSMSITENFTLDDCTQNSTLTATITLMGLATPMTQSDEEEQEINLTNKDERVGPVGGERDTPHLKEGFEESSTKQTNGEASDDSGKDETSSVLQNSPGKSDGGKSRLGLFLRRARMFSSSSALDQDFKPINPQGEISVAIVYREKTKKLVIGVFQARDLIGANEQEDKCDINPYVRTYLLPDRSRISRLTTDVVKQTQNPIFSETLWYSIESLEECRKKKLDLMVKSETPLFKKAKGVKYGLGRTIIDLVDEDLDDEEPVWRALYKVDD